MNEANQQKSRLQNLYVATTGYFQSYAIGSDMSLTYQSNVSTPSGCDNANFISVATESPYQVFGTPYGGACPSIVIAVDNAGTLGSVSGNVTYDTSAGVHGSDLSPDNKFFYSADDIGNGVWVHSYDSTTGTVEELQHLQAASDSDPRHITVHPNGGWAFAVYEAASSIASYERDNTTGLLTFTNTTYSLLPEGYTNQTNYWAGEVLISGDGISTSPKYLLAATRSRTVGIPGYVSAFALDADTGAVTSQLFLEPTTNSGGSANAVSPAKFDEQIFAITDSGSNFLEVWKIADDGASVAAVAHVDLEQGPANAVWFS